MELKKQRETYLSGQRRSRKTAYKCKQITLGCCLWGELFPWRREIKRTPNPWAPNKTRISVFSQHYKRILAQVDTHGKQRKLFFWSQLGFKHKPVTNPRSICWARGLIADPQQKSKWESAREKVQMVPVHLSVRNWNRRWCTTATPQLC